MQVVTDEEIIQRVLQGEKDLYGLIVRKYNERLYRIGISIMNDETEVEDAMQSAYLHAYENLRKFAFKASFSTWLIRILINECLLRRRIKKRIYHKTDEQKYFINTLETQTPVTKMLNSELKSKIEEAIRMLPEKYRIVFVMRELENMSVSETQASLNLSEVNVKVRLNRAKALLKNYLSNYFNRDEIFHFHLSRCDRIVEKVMDKIRSVEEK